MFWAFLIIIALVLIPIIRAKPEDLAAKAKQSLEESKKISTGKYIGGHPDIDNQVENTVIVPNNQSLDILSVVGFSGPVPIGVIET
ncbi:MAG: hypothetical protein ABI002_14615, partial [Saprospiraceae bacterium]